MKIISAQEVIEFHDRLLARDCGVEGMSDPGRADAIIHRVLNKHHYEGITDLYDLAAVYWVAIARGHIFNDANKRTAMFVTQLFLKRNGVNLPNPINIKREQVLVDLTVKAATGEMKYPELAAELRRLVETEL
ncbi:death-on-curing (DOC) family protein [Buttiauxella gaviniae ATCC 51604]|uniref:Death-on-curing (DOC) family protein n=1 Tax=Buttiauxella gaviniae ATCC 51604 TaxID=1354253 RepID=A0A1B7HK54_9ENTR|nr:type II toxin-antitoxin system death-on-curing family toxin [Buttiauxella gaviniae]OAT16010.1 death-on-curing (DOC) family protein [Buttiauxella gaviniae ATCC 51604]